MDNLYTDSQLDSISERILRSIFSNTQQSIMGVYQLPLLINDFPREIVEYMTDDLVIDINEMGGCFKNALYTSGMLMAFRIFEKTIKTHLEYDLNIKCNHQLHRSIQLLEKSFCKDFVRKLQKIRKIRNKTTHSDKVFNRDETIELIDDIVWVVVYVYSIIPEEQ